GPRRPRGYGGRPRRPRRPLLRPRPRRVHRVHPRASRCPERARRRGLTAARRLLDRAKKPRRAAAGRRRDGAGIRSTAPEPSTARVDPALVEVEFPLERPQDVVVDRPRRAQAQERLALRADHGPLDLTMLDNLPILLPGCGGAALPLDVLRLVLVGVTQ